MEEERDAFDDIIEKNLARRQRLEEGKYNCLPLPFDRFSKIFPGFEQGKYVLLTANQKVGKSKLADYLFVYKPLFTMMDHPELKVKVLYFSLEMSAEEKMNEFLCHLLYKLDGLRVSSAEIRNVREKADSKIYELLNTPRYRKYRRAFLSMVDFNDTDKNPTGINKKCRDYALAHGHLNYINYEEYNEESGKVVTKIKIDPINPYTQDDPDEYRIIILDNAANLSTEKGAETKMQTIDKMSKYGIILKKQLNYVFVLIQHQAQAQEGIENIKLNRMEPSSDGLGDCKTTSRDANCVIGLYNPAKFEVEKYKGFNTFKLGDYGRFMKVLEDRDYGAGGNTCPLFFDGAVCDFKELPDPEKEQVMDKIYKYCNNLKAAKQQKTTPTTTKSSLLLTSAVKEVIKHHLNLNM